METRFTLVKWPLRLGTILLFNLLISFSASAQVPVNDTYAAPTVLTSGATCTNIGGTVENATPTAGDPLLTANPGYDVWYQFTAMSVNPVIDVSSIGANFTNSRIQVLGGTLGTFTTRFNGTPAAALTANLSLIIGTTYYIRVYSSPLTPAPTTLGTFNICITDVTAPVNDVYTSAVPLTSGATCVTPVTGNIANATHTTGDGAVTGCVGSTGDVWYTFTAQSVNPVITLTNIGTGIGANARIQVLGGTFGSFVSKFCGTDVQALTGPYSLSIGQSYYIRIHLTNLYATPNANANFDICITDIFTPPANDAFGSVVTLTSAPTCGTPVTGNLANATPSTGDPAFTAGCSSGTGDVWYTFTAQSVNPVITMGSVGTTITSSVRMQVLGGAYGSFLIKQCALTPTTALTLPLSLIIGQQYYIRVYNSGTTTPNLNAGFDLCITDIFTPPANDAFGSVVTLTSGPTCGTPVTGNLANSTPSAGDGAITGCNGVTGDVWYTFIAQSVNPVITMGSVGSAITASVRMQVLGGVYGSFLSKACTLNPTTALTSPLSLTIGQQYYIRVYNNASTTPNLNAGFDLCITDIFTPPANDAFGSVVTLTSAPTCVAPVNGNLANSTPSAGDAAITACNGVTGDVWYTFTAQSVNPVITMLNVGTAITASVRIQVLEGTYGSFISKVCILTPTTALSLIIGQQYYIRIYNNATTTPNLNAGFDICITDVIAPVNDAFGSAITLTSGATCVTPVTGTIANASPTTGDAAITGGCSPTSGDVWYTFTPLVTNPLITLSGFGANLTIGNARVQILEGTPGSLISRYCGTPATLLTTALNLTIGTPVYIRINTFLAITPNSAANFDICITNPAPPVNDEPAGVIDLTSAAACVNVTGTVGNATYNSSYGAVACAGTDKYDVWYRFTAQRVNPTITLSSVGTNAASARIQVLAGTPGSFTSMGCSAALIWNFAGLVPGQVYYVRVYSTATTIPTTTTSNFNICITDPPIPVNDDCINATVLTPSNTNTGINTGGTLMNANNSPAIPGDCGDAGSPDVWYSFVASRPYQEVRVSGAGAQLTASGLRVQILTGTCGSFTSFMCNTATANSLITVPTSTPFTVGQTYYVRVYSNAPISAQTAATWTFNINVATPDVATYHYGKAYANITKGPGGGTIEPGDELEIRGVLNVRSNAIYNASYTDIIPANTTYIPGTLRILTNEGKIWRQFTDAADGDPGTILGTNVTINIGKDASETSGGMRRQGDRPGGVIMVSFRVNVNSVPFGTVLQLGGGTFNFNVSDAVGSAAVIAYGPNPAMVYQNYGICTNTIGTNGILSEFGGTFGSGNTKNRGSSNKVPANYTYANFTTGMPGDYYYGVSNNTSSDSLANYSINPNDPIGNPKRVFNIWDIIGDHTGAADPLLGNLPADVNNGGSGGYMVVINAAYRADTAFQDTVRNLCPSTSYEYSAWFRNICQKCGVDSNGVQALNPGYIPTGPGDSSGVHPNLTFNINGNDYYTTGDIFYTGQWIKKGFTYRTGPTETEMVINIRNNAPGGGGNDWAIDDIGVATCSPTLLTNPDSSVVAICYGDGRALSAQVISYYDNFTHWIWEKSVDTGTTWIGTGYSGNTIPALVSGNYEYTATGPAVPGDSATHSNQFRLRVASSADNLSDINCSFRAIRTIQVMVQNCMYVLKTRVTPLTGKLENGFGTLSWSGANEEAGLVYVVEKSTNGSGYTAIATIKGKSAAGIGIRYNFRDPDVLKSATYYRVLVKEANGQEYTRVVLLSPAKLDVEIRNLINPFYQQVSFDLITPAEGNARVTIIDQFGRIVKTINEHVHSGITPIQISNFGVLSNGVYTLKVEFGDKVITKRIAKVHL